MACVIHISEASCQIPSIGWVLAAYPQTFLGGLKLVDLGLHYSGPKKVTSDYKEEQKMLTI
jgi:hypothetical protein